MAVHSAALPKSSPLAEYIRYGLNHWEGLVLFLDDGRIELDTNRVEREIPCPDKELFAGADYAQSPYVTFAESSVDIFQRNALSKSNST